MTPIGLLWPPNFFCQSIKFAYFFSHWRIAKTKTSHTKNSKLWLFFIFPISVIDHLGIWSEKCVRGFEDPLYLKKNTNPYLLSEHHQLIKLSAPAVIYVPKAWGGAESAPARGLKMRDLPIYKFISFFSRNCHIFSLECILWRKQIWTVSLFS